MLNNQPAYRLGFRSGLDTSKGTLIDLQEDEDSPNKQSALQSLINDTQPDIPKTTNESMLYNILHTLKNDEITVPNRRNLNRKFLSLITDKK